jgi:ubiquinone/menaquinone biosynthesis C-methylase UbiE
VSVATLPYSGPLQGELWSARALDWANHQEPQLHEVYTAVLASVPQLAGKRLLDVGCGSGAFLRRAAKHGAIVSGLDAAAGLVAITRKRVPDADLRIGDLSRLPFDRGTFDIVTGINAFPEAADPVAALAEARRVLRSGGRVVAVTWGSAERSDAAAHLTAINPLLPPVGELMPSPFGYPFAYAEPLMLTRLVEAAGFVRAAEHEVTSTWDYPDLTALLRGLLSTGPMVRAVAHSGSHAVSAAVVSAVHPYRTDTGGYRLRNVFRYVVAEA